MIMRRLQVFLSLFLLLLCFPSFAQSVESVNVDVLLQDDGSAIITETWSIDVPGDITEWYLGKENMGPMEIRDLKVTDDSGTEYFNEGNDWDIDRSISRKAGRCGLVQKNDGCEICWGVGSRGPHTYVVSYLQTNLVKAYTDADGFNHMFVTPTDGRPQSVVLTIRKLGTVMQVDSAHVWGFRFIGEVQQEDGVLKAWSTEPFSDESAMIVMASFEKGIFNPEIVCDYSFEDVKTRAFRDSDYFEREKKISDLVEIIIFGLFVLFFVFIILLVVVLLISYYIKYKKKKRELLGGSIRKIPWFRDTPVGGDLRHSSLILSKFTSNNNSRMERLIAAYMLRLFYRGAFEITLDKGKPALKVCEFEVEPSDDTNEDTALEFRLYGFIKEAAGSDGILQSRELKKWLDSHGKGLYNWQEKAQLKSDIFSLKKRDVQQVLGLKKFLEDFTMIDDRGAVEVKLWNNYLIFASLYGIADKVFKDFKKVCPEYFLLSKQMAQFNGEGVPAVFWSTVHNTSRNFHQAANSYHISQLSSSGGSSGRFGGGGGRSSWGGGGGFSGGGRSGGR